MFSGLMTSSFTKEECAVCSVGTMRDNERGSERDVLSYAKADDNLTIAINPGLIHLVPS